MWLSVLLHVVGLTATCPPTSPQAGRTVLLSETRAGNKRITTSDAEFVILRLSGLHYPEEALRSLSLGLLHCGHALDLMQELKQMFL